MADKNIQMKVLNSSGAYDNLMPRSNANLIVANDTNTVQSYIDKIIPGITLSGSPVTASGVLRDCISSCVVHGLTTETGTGDKSPDNPYTLAGAQYVQIKGLQLIQLPQPLYSLPDGTADGYDAVSGSGTQKIGKIVLDENINMVYGPSGVSGIAMIDISAGNMIKATYGPGICSHYKNVGSGKDTNTIRFGAGDSVIYIYISADIYPDLATYKSFLFAQKSAANPVTVLYPLATPQAISGTPTQLLNAPGKFTATTDGASLDVTISGAASTAGLDVKAERSTVTTATLPASGWTGSAAPYSYALSVAAVTATSANELLPGASITADQLDALQSANIQDGGQAAGHITLLAYGDKPGIDLPVRVIVRGDL